MGVRPKTVKVKKNEKMKSQWAICFTQSHVT